MISLSSIIATFETEFLARFAKKLLPGQRRARAAMKECRTTASPYMEARCEACEHRCFVPHSCGHRACPHCQHHESEQWLERQIKALVPGDYFLLTFTLPTELRLMAWGHQRTIYDALMRCSWETLRSFSLNDKDLRGTPGVIAVLNTPSRRLDYHPPVHMVMPACGDRHQKSPLAQEKGQGQIGVSVQPQGTGQGLSGQNADGDLLRQDSLLPPSHPEKWVVDCKAVGAGKKALIYLGRTLYRGVIREKDILSCKEGQVRFRYKDSKT